MSRRLLLINVSYLVTEERQRADGWMGNALKNGYRQKVFLMTKIDGRTKGAAKMQIDETL